MLFTWASVSVHSVLWGFMGDCIRAYIVRLDIKQFANIVEKGLRSFRIWGLFGAEGDDFAVEIYGINGSFIGLFILEL